MVASLLQPDVWRFEVAPWPERVFGGHYPKPGKPGRARAHAPGLRDGGADGHATRSTT